MKELVLFSGAAGGEATFLSAAGADWLESIARVITQILLYWLERIPGLAEPMVGSFTWASLLTFLVFLLGVGLLHGLLCLYARGKRPAGQTPAEVLNWRVLVVRAASPPVTLMLWVGGVYFAFTPLFIQLEGQGGIETLRALLSKLLDFGLFFAVFWLFFRSTRVLEPVLIRAASGTESALADVLAPLLIRVLRVIVPVVAILLGLPLIGLPAEFDVLVRKAGSLLMIGAVTWILCQAVSVGESFLLRKYDIRAADNLQARGVHTQARVLKRTLFFIIGIVAAASAMMLFDEVRRLGTSILASAGVLGIILGVAAQRSIANIFAGLQLALTQPIRLDDVVIVENEWGRIEEVNLTYVVVRIWDMRRLIVPLSHFIERPFQNWTRVSADILGAVFFYTDYTVPVDKVREELRRVVEASPDWDRKVCGLQVTNTNDKTMELRALASSADASKAWNLRCEIREKIIAFLQKNYPDSLPKVRVAMTSPAVADRKGPLRGEGGV